MTKTNKQTNKKPLLIACNLERESANHFAWPHGLDRFAHSHIHVSPEVKVDGITQVSHGAQTLKHTTANAW